LNKQSKEIPQNVKNKFFKTLKSVSGTGPAFVDTHKKKLLSNLDILTDSEAGIRFIYDHVDEIIEAGIFEETMWDDPHRLVPSLVSGTLKAGGQNTIYEILSEIRIAAITNEILYVKKYPATKARGFLEETLVNNLNLVFTDNSEEFREMEKATRRKIRALFSFLTDVVSIESMKHQIAREIELICVQRPVVTDRVLKIIDTVRQHIDLTNNEKDDKRINSYIQAVYSPSVKAGKMHLDEYRDFLDQATHKELLTECEQISDMMQETGLTSAYHALLLRRVAENATLIKTALKLNDRGKAELDAHKPFVTALIGKAIHPQTARSCFGLARLLERSLLSHQPVKSGLKRIMDMKIHTAVTASIRKSKDAPEREPVEILLADCLCVLGLPLGIGQGWNPTCQSARGISLWSSHAPGKLLRMIESAAKSNSLSMRFEGQLIKSDELTLGLVKKLDFNLDAVSVVLVPQLDKLYNEMMRRAANRGEDPHKWVNPAMYGHWIPTGFISAYDYLTNTIKNYEKFLRTFYITHHPDYNGGHDLAYPNPVGIFLTSSTGKLIGFHAVSILRVHRVKGQVRVFILNPNNEGRQRWQDNIRPTVAGNGERQGESSLPFYQFASRLYAFHFNHADLEDLSRVDDEEINNVTRMAKESWGESYQWIDQISYAL